MTLNNLYRNSVKWPSMHVESRYDSKSTHPVNAAPENAAQRSWHDSLPCNDVDKRLVAGIEYPTDRGETYVLGLTARSMECTS